MSRLLTFSSGSVQGHHKWCCEQIHKETPASGLQKNLIISVHLIRKICESSRHFSSCSQRFFHMNWISSSLVFSESLLLAFRGFIKTIYVSVFIAVYSPARLSSASQFEALLPLYSHLTVQIEVFFPVLKLKSKNDWGLCPRLSVGSDMLDSPVVAWQIFSEIFGHIKLTTFM